MIRTVTLTPGAARAYDPGEWAGALVVLARGRLELEGRAGDRVVLSRGAVFWLAGLPVRALHNRGDEDAVLVAVTRRAAGGAGRAERAAGVVDGGAGNAASRAERAAGVVYGGAGNARAARTVLEDMTLPLLLLFAAGTVLPCLGLWLADERARMRRSS